MHGDKYRELVVNDPKIFAQQLGFYSNKPLYLLLMVLSKSARLSLGKAIILIPKIVCFILGPEVSRFEKKFAEYLGVEETIGVASGTDALRLSCRALGIGPGDEVLIPANTFIATALAVYDLGATVVPVDVDPETYLMDLSDAISRITQNTKAIIPVHLCGQCLDMDAIAEFTKKIICW